MALRDLGFSPAAETVYRALVDDPLIHPHSLAARVGEELRPALAQLVELRVARPDPSRPTGLSPRNPAVALAELIERVEADLLRRHRRVADTRTELAELAERCRREPARVSELERLRDAEAVREALAELSFFTRSSVYAVHADGAPDSGPLGRRALRRGLDLRILCAETAQTGAKDLAAAGAQVRVARHAVDPMIILDERVAVIPEEGGALLVRAPSLITGFVRLYHRVWAQATSPAWEAGEEPLHETDRRLLELLASGATDEAAARVVGFSVRHLRRRVAALMERLEAGSRFEAGVAAAHRGWIRPAGS